MVHTFFSALSALRFNIDALRSSEQRPRRFSVSVHGADHFSVRGADHFSGHGADHFSVHGADQFSVHGADLLVPLYHIKGVSLLL